MEDELIAALDGTVPSRARRMAAALAGSALHADVAPDSVLSGLLGWLLTGIAQQRGWPVPAVLQPDEYRNRMERVNSGRATESSSVRSARRTGS